ncbi:MAG: alpha-L-rhamnosidase [Clostridia bacterium]|nr:alpha-L-rhamnosidase [Clostridia bacterium]
MINNLLRASEYKDPRARMPLLPVRIVKTWGRVLNADALLEDSPAQAFLGKFSGCVMINTCGSERAAVLLDFGAEFHGSCRLTAGMIDGGVKFARLKIRFGESVSEAVSELGYKNAGCDHACRDQEVVMSGLSVHETNESGFRFAYIELMDDKAVGLVNVHGVMIYRDIERLGKFSCSDPLIEKIWETAVYTVHMCMQEYLWDGIKRDRLVWMGDMHTEILTILTAFGKQDVIEKSLDFMKIHTPASDWMNGLPSYSLWWVIANRDLYMRTGDRDYLLKQEEYLKQLSKRLIDIVDEDGCEQIPPKKFLDWPTSDDDAASHEGMQGLLKTALDAAADMLAEMGNDALSEKCRIKAELMKKHIPEASGNLAAASILALSGVSDAKETNDKIIKPTGAKGYSCLMGGYILNAKAKAGDITGALNDMRAYWGGMLSMGATTFWEDFSLDWLDNASPLTDFVPEGKRDIHGDFGAYCYKNLRHSFCHGWASGPVPFITENVLGVKAIEPGYKKVSIKGNLGDLEYAKGEVPTPYGIIKVCLSKNESGETVSEISVPEGIEIVK